VEAKEWDKGARNASKPTMNGTLANSESSEFFIHHGYQKLIMTGLNANYKKAKDIADLENKDPKTAFAAFLDANEPYGDPTINRTPYSTDFGAIRFNFTSPQLAKDAFNKLYYYQLSDGGKKVKEAFNNFSCISKGEQHYIIIPRSYVKTFLRDYLGLKVTAKSIKGGIKKNILKADDCAWDEAINKAAQDQLDIVNSQSNAVTLPKSVGQKINRAGYSYDMIIKAFKELTGKDDISAIDNALKASLPKKLLGKDADLALKKMWWTDLSAIDLFSRALERTRYSSNKKFIINNLLQKCNEYVLEDASKGNAIPDELIKDKIFNSCFDFSNRITESALSCLAGSNTGTIEKLFPVGPFGTYLTMRSILVDTPKQLNNGKWDLGDNGTALRTVNGVKNFAHKYNLKITDQDLLDLRLSYPLVLSVLSDNFKKERFDEPNRTLILGALPSILKANNGNLTVDEIHALSGQIDCLHKDLAVAIEKARKNNPNLEFADILADRKIKAILVRHEEALEEIYKSDLPIVYIGGDTKHIPNIQKELEYSSGKRAEDLSFAKQVGRKSSNGWSTSVSSSNSASSIGATLAGGDAIDMNLETLLEKLGRSRDSSSSSGSGLTKK
jgi:hypothetical protein